MLMFLRIRIPRFKPDREVNKWLPIILTLDKINVFCKGGRAKFSVHTQQKNELGPENASLSGNTWPYATSFQPIAALGVP
jgi:hypothetical protein